MVDNERKTCQFLNRNLKNYADMIGENSDKVFHRRSQLCMESTLDIMVMNLERPSVHSSPVLLCLIFRPF